MNNLQQTSFDGNVYNVSSNVSPTITALITSYKSIAADLEVCAEAIPQTPEEMKALVKEEARLLDQQASILSMALSRKPRTLEDAKALLWLWQKEVVAQQPQSNLTEAEKLVASVCDFLEVV